MIIALYDIILDSEATVVVSLMITMHQIIVQSWMVPLSNGSYLFETDFLPNGYGEKHTPQFSCQLIFLYMVRLSLTKFCPIKFFQFKMLVRI